MHMSQRILHSRESRERALSSPSPSLLFLSLAPSLSVSRIRVFAKESFSRRDSREERLARKSLSLHDREFWSLAGARVLFLPSLFLPLSLSRVALCTTDTREKDSLSLYYSLFSHLKRENETCEKRERDSREGERARA